MNILNKITLKSLKLNKKRTIVTCIGIILSVALICAVAGMITSFQGTLVHFEKIDGGNYHVRFNDVPNNDLKLIENNKSIESYFLTKNIGYSLFTNTNEYKPFVYLMAFNDKALNESGIKLLEGKMPSNDSEIVIPAHLNKIGEADLKIGDTLTLNFGKRMLDGKELEQVDDYISKEIAEETNIKPETFELTKETKSYTIVGIIERPDSVEGYSAPGYTIITHLNEKNIDSANISVLYKNSKKYVENTAKICEVDKLTSTNCKYQLKYHTDLLRWEGASLNEEMLNLLYAVGGIVILIILVTSVFVIKNSFSISITERLKQYGMLSSVGATSKQIRKNVLYEGFILGIVSIPLGILLGILAIIILLWLVNLILADMLNGIKFIYSVPFSAILIGILVGSLTIFLSVIFSARKAAKVSPIEAIRSNNDIKIKSKKLRTPLYIKKFFKIGGEISYKNLKRSRKKYRTTIVSLVVSISIFIALTTFINYGFKMSGSYYTNLNYDYSFYNGNDTIFNLIKNLDGIEKYNIQGNTYMNIDGDKYLSQDAKDYLKENVDLENYNQIIKETSLNIISMSNDYYKEFISKVGFNYENVKDKGIILDGNTYYTDEGVKHQISYYNLNSGDTISGTNEDKSKNYNIIIGGITSEQPMGLEFTYSDGGYLLVSEDTIKQFDNVDRGRMFVKTSDYDKFSDAIKKFINETPEANNISVDDINDYAKQMNSMVLVVSIFLYGFIAVITLIGVTNIFNTITTNMNLRSKEFAMLKSIGMTSKEFNHMIRLESVFYGTKSLLFGIPIGLILSYLLHKSFSEGYVIAFIWPIKPIILSIIFVFIIVSITMRFSLNKINKQNIIDTIRNDNI